LTDGELRVLEAVAMTQEVGTPLNAMQAALLRAFAERLTVFSAQSQPPDN
jgi:hypothetical protein